MNYLRPHPYMFSKQTTMMKSEVKSVVMIKKMVRLISLNTMQGNNEMLKDAVQSYHKDMLLFVQRLQLFYDDLTNLSKDDYFPTIKEFMEYEREYDYFRSLS